MQLVTASDTAVRGNDSRLSDARPPIAHDASLITSGLVAPERLGTGTASSETVLYGDGVFRPPSGGSGGVNVRQGRMDKLSVAIGGSGDVRYGGATRDLDVAIAGSGSVRVASATGSVSRSVVGSGTLQIGR